MPEYMLLIYEDGTSAPAPDSPQAMAEFGEYNVFTEDIRKKGQFVSGAPLQTSDTATTVRVTATAATRPHRRPVRRDQGEARRLLRRRLPRPRRGDRAGGPDPGGPLRRDRGAAGRWNCRRDVSARDDAVERAFREEGRARPRHAHPPGRRLRRWPRTRCRTRSRRPSATWPRDGVPAQPGRVDHRRPRAGGRSTACAASARWPTAPGAWPTLDASSTPTEPRARGPRSAVRRRRPPAPDLHVLPPGAGARGARGADAAHARRPDHGRDRPRLPGPRADDGPAPRPRQAQDRRRAASRTACRPTTSCPSACAGVLAVVYLIFNEGYAAARGRPPGPRRAVRRGDPPRPPARRADARRPRGRSACWRSCCCTTPAATRASTRTARYVALDRQDRARWDRGPHRARARARWTRALRLRPARAVPAAGGDRRAARDRRRRRGDRLGADRRALRRARAPRAVAGRRGQPRGRARLRRRAARPACAARRRCCDDRRLAGYQPLHAAHAELLRRAGDDGAAGGRLRRARSRCSANAVERAELERRRAAAVPALRSCSLRPENR